MINGITLSALRNAEFLQFIFDVRDIVQANNPALLQVPQQQANFIAAINQINALFATDQGNDITPIIQALDTRRDAAIEGIWLVVNGYLRHFDPNIAAAAQAIADNLQLYGNGQTGIATLNYRAETASITSIIEDWNTKPNLTAAIATLQLNDWQAELENANTNFNTQYLARNHEIGAANPNTLRDKRLETVQLYYALRDRIVAFHTINNGANPWGTTVNDLNAIIDQNNIILAGRSNEPIQPEPTPVPPSQG